MMVMGVMIMTNEKDSKAEDLNKKRQLVEKFKQIMQCNCDLDNWVPEPDTGHSWVCCIDKAVRSEICTKYN